MLSHDFKHYLYTVSKISLSRFKYLTTHLTSPFECQNLSNLTHLKLVFSQNLSLLPLKLAFLISSDANWDGYKDNLSKEFDI